MKGLVLVMITLALTNALPLKNGNVTELETEIGDTFCFNSHLLSLKILWFRLKSNGKSYTNFVFFVFCLSFSISDGRDPVKLDEEKIGKSFRTSAILRKKHRYLLNTLLLLWAIAKSSYFFFLFLNFIQEDSTRTGDQKRLNIWFIPVEISRLFMVDLFRTE